MLTRRQRALLCLQEENELIPLGRTQVRAWRKARATTVPQQMAPQQMAPAPAAAPLAWTWKPMAMKASKFPVTDVPVPYSVEFVSTWYSDISEDEEEASVPTAAVQKKHKIKTKKERLLGRC